MLAAIRQLVLKGDAHFSFLFFSFFQVSASLLQNRVRRISSGQWTRCFYSILTNGCTRLSVDGYDGDDVLRNLCELPIGIA